MVLTGLDFFCEDFLRHLYDSASAFYAFAGCPIVDFAAPIQIKYDSAKGEEEQVSWIPLLVSAKSHEYFSPSDAKRECERMKAAAEAVIGKDSSRGALCLLAVFGSRVKSDDGDLTLTENVVDELVDGKVVCRVLRIPFNDKFKSTQCFVEICSDEMGMAEIFASHAFIRGYASDQRQEELKAEYALRGKADDDSKALLNTLSAELNSFTILEDPGLEAKGMDLT